MFCHRNFCDQYVINGLKPLKMGPNCTERKWIIIQPSMWRVSIYNTFQREELVRRSIFTEGKFLVYKSQDASRRQLKHCDKKHQWVVHQNSGWSLWRKHWWWWWRSRGSHSRRSRPSRGVYDCWRFGSRFSLTSPWQRQMRVMYLQRPGGTKTRACCPAILKYSQLCDAW